MLLVAVCWALFYHLVVGWCQTTHLKVPLNLNQPNNHKNWSELARLQAWLLTTVFCRHVFLRHHMFTLSTVKTASKLGGWSFFQLFMGLLWLPYGIFSSCAFFFFVSFFLAYSQLSQIGCIPYFVIWCALNANLECRSEMCCKQLAENTGCKTSLKVRHLRNIAQLYS